MLLIFWIPLSHSINSGIIRNPTIPTIFICALIRFGNEAGIVGHARLFSLTDVDVDCSLIAISECCCLPNLGLNSYQQEQERNDRYLSHNFIYNQQAKAFSLILIYYWILVIFENIILLKRKNIVFKLSFMGKQNRKDIAFRIDKDPNELFLFQRFQKLTFNTFIKNATKLLFRRGIL